MSTKQTEALKLALEALEWEFGLNPVGKKTHETITAIREALAEQPAQQTIHCKHRRENDGVCPHHNLHCGWPKCNEPEQPAQQEPVSDRENAIIRFALHQFMSNAYSNMNAAAQDKDSRHYTVGAVEKFAKDAKDAEALLSRLQFKAPQPAQRKPWVGLTDEEKRQIFEREDYQGWLDYINAIEAKLKEKNT